jgi:hypothetical protein
LNNPATPRSCRARAQACSKRSTSRATISRDDMGLAVRAPPEVPAAP